LSYVEALVGFVVFFLYASFFEWTLHRFLMHTRVWAYPFNAHAVLHHGLFRSGPSYLLPPGQNYKNIRFAWWNAPLIIGLHAPALLWIGWMIEADIFYGGMAALCVYYFLYEYLHFCMHVPKGRWLERCAWFSWLDAHHHQHHERHFTNLNVVLPLADLILGTLITAERRIPRPLRNVPV
jgi:hypothetical protein